MSPRKGTKALLSAVAFAVVLALAGPASGATGGTTALSNLSVMQPPWVPGEVLVRFGTSVPGERRAEIRQQENARLEERLPLPGVQLLDLEPGTTVREAVEGLEERSAVIYAEPNFIRTATAVPNDQFFGLLWGLNNFGQTVAGVTGTFDADVDAPAAWDVTKGSPSVTVGIADTGVDYTHPDLAANVDVAAGFDWVGNDPADKNDDDEDPQDENGHGTHVAGTAGAVGNNSIGITGVNWDVALVPLRILNAEGGGDVADAASALSYAGSTGIDVVNGSFSGGPSQTEQNAIANSPDTLFVFAAGNNGSAAPEYPCAYPQPNIICVAATNQFDQRASFSNFGAHVDLAAPGTKTLSTYPFAPVFEDDFETGLDGWEKDGTEPNTWGLTMEETANMPRSPQHSLADSPNANYQPNTDNFIRTAPINLSGKQDCFLETPVELHIPDAGPFGDVFFIEASSDGKNWTTLSAFNGSGFDVVVDDLAAFEGKPSVFIRYRFRENGVQLTPTGNGALVDDVGVLCRLAGYAFLNGTSMASPHVAGAAGLYLAAHPTACVANVKNAILAGVDAKASLGGIVATGGRLNAATSLAITSGSCGGGADVTPPDTAIISGPAGLTRNPAPSFSFAASEAAGFQCSMDFGPFFGCGSTHSTSTLANGPHTLRVRAVDLAGNIDPSPASRSFTVDASRPQTTIFSGPRRFTRDRTPTFRFGSSEGGSRFQCKVDARAFVGCTSPFTTRLTRRWHTLRFRAIDRAGNTDPTPAKRTFRVRRR